MEYAIPEILSHTIRFFFSEQEIGKQKCEKKKKSE